MIWYWIIIAVSMLLNLTLIIACIAQGGRAQKEREERITNDHAWMRAMETRDNLAQSLREAVSFQEAINKDFRLEIEVLEGDLANMETLKKEAEKERDDYQCRMNAVIIDMDNYRNQTCDLIKQRDELQRLLDVLNGEYDRIESDNRDLRFIKDADNKRIEELQDLADSRQRKIEVLDGNVKALMNDLNHAGDKLTEQTAEIEHLAARNEDLSRKLIDKSRELDSAKKSVATGIFDTIIDALADVSELENVKRERDQFDQEIAQLRKHVIPALQDNLMQERKLSKELSQERDKLTVELDTLEERFIRYRAHVDGFLDSLFLPEMKLTAFFARAKDIMEAPSTEQALAEACST